MATSCAALPKGIGIQDPAKGGRAEDEPRFMHGVEFAPTSWAGGDLKSLDRLSRIHAPELVLLDVAVELVVLQPAPVA